jgi:hypothetical protein
MSRPTHSKDGTVLLTLTHWHLSPSVVALRRCRHLIQSLPTLISLDTVSPIRFLFLRRKDGGVKEEMVTIDPSRRNGFSFRKGQ